MSDECPQAPRPDDACPRPGSVLVVDDSGVNRYLLAQSVTNLGHRAASAPNGRVALEMLGGEPFDLVLLDLMMPELDGYAVLERMKAMAAELRDELLGGVDASSLETALRVLRAIRAKL